jgi:phosphoribosyl 1,2-cyclic phosphodiesterase
VAKKSKRNEYPYRYQVNLLGVLRVAQPISRKSLTEKQASDGSKAGQLQVTFWGVRGTLPSPGRDFVEYGGNTSCVEVSAPSSSKEPGTSLVLDAGTGLVAYGEAALARNQKVFHILLSHYHYDHIIGLTRFSAMFRPDVELHFYGQAKGGLELHQIIERIFAFPFFPVEYRHLPSRNNMKFHTVVPGSPFEVGSLIIVAHELNHPQQSVAYRVWDHDLSTSVVYATDHEHGTDSDLSLAAFARNANLLLFDTTYTDDVYEAGKKNWGHATARSGAEIAAMAEVKAFGLFHHDPDSTDALLQSKLLPEALAYFPASFLCKEGQTILLNSQIPDEQLPMVVGGGSPIRRTLLSKRRKISG